jgi:hypothetical protein
MIVYPNEYHNKWQPAHILAMYDRCIEWFAFWLRGEPPADPVRAARWEQLARAGDGPVPGQARQ